MLNIKRYTAIMMPKFLGDAQKFWPNKIIKEEQL